MACKWHELARLVVLRWHVDHRADQRHRIFGKIAVEGAIEREKGRLLEDVPGVVARHSRVHIGIVCTGTGVGRPPLTASPADMLGRGIVRAVALAVADGLSDVLVGKVSLGTDPPYTPFRPLHAVK